MTENTLISIISPVYGCRNCLEALADAVRDAFDGSGLDWELVLVDDRAPDNPWPVICELAERDPRIRGVRLSRNHGQHLAIWAGLAAARGDYIAIVDCDLQDDPSVIPGLHERIRKEHADAVLVDRGAWSDSRFRRMASRSFYGLVKYLTGVQIKNIGNFGLYSRRMVDTLLMFEEQEGVLTSDGQSDRVADDPAQGGSRCATCRQQFLFGAASAATCRRDHHPLY